MRIIYILLISSYIIASPLFAMVPNPLDDGSSQTPKKTLTNKNPSDEDSDGEDSAENKDDIWSSIAASVSSSIAASVSTSYNALSSLIFSKEEKTIIPSTKNYFSHLPIEHKLHIVSLLTQHDMLNLFATSKDLLKMRSGVGVEMQETSSKGWTTLLSSSPASLLAWLISEGGDQYSASSIRSLYFFPANLSNEDLESLSSFSNLRTLGLQNCPLQKLPNLNNFISLTSLKVGVISNDTPQGSSPLTNLTYLNLHSIYDFSGDRLQYSSMFPNLQCLRLNANEMVDFPHYNLNSLSRFQNLTFLEMVVNKSSGEFHFNCNLPAHLTSLKMDINKIRGALHLNNLTNLKLLRFDAKEMEDDSRLGLSLPTSLQSLECDFPLLEHDALKWLYPLINLTSLKLKRQDIDYLARAVLHHLTNLTELDVLPCVVSAFLYDMFGDRYITFGDSSIPFCNLWIDLQKHSKLKRINNTDINCFRRQNSSLGKDDIATLQSQIRPEG